MYHRIIPRDLIAPSQFQKALIASAEGFRENLLFLRANYSVISLTEYLTISQEASHNKKERYAIITLDDGWCDNYEYAYPLLKELKLPATIFLATAFIGSSKGFWWQTVGDILSAPDANQQAPMINCLMTYGLLDAGIHNSPSFDSLLIDKVITKLKSKPQDDIEHIVMELLKLSTQQDRPHAMNWTQVEEMSKHGIEFGPHTANHTILTTLPTNDAKKEIIDSQAVLRNRDNINYCNVFSFPNGNSNEETREIVKQQGFDAAVSVDCGLTHFNDQRRYQLPRINIPYDVAESNSLFQYRLFKASIHDLKRRPHA
ncbi:MAG: polysaccharide deacetylase family protein [Pseudomonadales bacterium]|nr:polysaccharide deacetylase family protein [Pseudomonadales bacterium]